MAILDDVIPELRDAGNELVRAAAAAGLSPRVTSGRRTRAQQERLYRRYLAGQSRFPAAPPGTSAHEYGYAFDLLVYPESALADVGATWISWGGVWHPSDPIHMEYPGFSPGAVLPAPGNVFYALADILSGFVPFLGEAQMVDTIYRLLGGNETTAEFYLQHPAEALRDLFQVVI